VEEKQEKEVICGDCRKTGWLLPAALGFSSMLPPLAAFPSDCVVLAAACMPPTPRYGVRAARGVSSPCPRRVIATNFGTLQ